MARSTDWTGFATVLQNPDTKNWTSELASMSAMLRDAIGNGTIFDDDLRDLSQLLLSINISAGAEERVEMLILLASYEEERNSSFAVRLLTKAKEVAELASAWALKRRVLNILGGTHYRAKNFTKATICYVEALELATQLGDKMGRCAVIANMAALRQHMGMVDDCIKLSQLVLQLCGTESHLSILRNQAHQNLAEAFLALSDAPAARDHALEALATAEEPGDSLAARNRTFTEATLVRALVTIGDIQQAETHADISSKYARQAGTRSARIQGELSKALCEGARGAADIALTRLAAVEGEITQSEIGFQDFLDIERQANLWAGRKEDAAYFNRKYLSCLAEYQRKRAIAIVAEAKRLIKGAEVAELSGDRGRKFDLQKKFAAQMDELATLAELREDASGDHCYRVGILSRMLAVASGYKEASAILIEHAARLHDIGKLATPDVVLLKRAKLWSSEQQVMRRHTTEGSQILTDLLYTVEASNIFGADQIADGLRLAAEIAQYHHERWDGDGYPHRIAGVMIPEAARIVALADVYDELTHARPYKESISKRESIEQIRALAGRQFDPRLCAHLVDVVENLADVLPVGEAQPSAFVAANRVINRIVATVP